MYLKVNSNKQVNAVETLNELIHKSYDGNYLYIFVAKKRERIVQIENMFNEEDVLSSSYDFEE